MLPGVLATVVGLGVVALVGCKGNSAPVPQQRSVAPPPTLRVLPADGDALVDNPLVSATWKKASWQTLTMPLHETRTAPLTRAAVLYSQTQFYVAFTCVENNPATSPADSIVDDRAEIWLDTSTAQNGTDIFCLSVTSTGKSQSSWYRSSSPAEPKDDGSPDYQHPISQIPDVSVTGLEVRTSKTTFDGQPAWTAVVAIPLKSLPVPLRIDPSQIQNGSHWRANLIRSDLFTRQNGPGDLLQANLAPIYPACQQISGYRMAPMVLEGPTRVALGSADPK